MKISCLMPTFNRFPSLGYLVEESVESFIRQDYEDRELIVCNDTPGHKLVIDHPKVKVFNVDQRFLTLSSKIQFMVDQAQGEALCRWDDDDISLPHRLSLSANKIQDRLEWRSTNYFYDTGPLREVDRAGNTHIMSLWRREVLQHMGGQYPAGLSGSEDQAFNRALAKANLGSEERLASKDIFYLYRWNTGSSHLSGIANYEGNPLNPHQDHYDALGNKTIHNDTFHVRPRWYRNYIAQVEQHLRRPGHPLDPLKIANYFTFAPYYDRVVQQMPRGAKLVEVGCLCGSSLCYLGNAARRRENRLEVIGVDLGIGIENKSDYLDIPGLVENIRLTGCQDIVTLFVGESTKVARYFPDESLHLVNLDAGHRRNDILSDLQAWWPKIAKGGRLAGHDYNIAEWPEVPQVVNAFFQSDNLGVPETPTMWEKVKR
jgi:glycosyltransferase involved in cell wall biosynthesis